MHVGLVSATYLPINNGVTRMVALNKKYLEKAGHRATIITLGEFDAVDLEAGIVRSRGIRLADTGYYFARRYSEQAQNLLAQVDILHAHHLLMGLDFAHKYGQSPLVYTNHTRQDIYAETYLKLPRLISRILMRVIWLRLMRYSDVNVVPSHSSRKLLQSFTAEMDIQVIENGIELEHFVRRRNSTLRRELGFTDKDVLMIYVGRLAKEKNLEKLISEFEIALQLDDKINLLLVGSGPQKQEIRKVINMRKLGQKVVLVGEVPYRAVSNYLSVADIFVTASLSEIAPLTLIEAMAAGLPILAIDAPGVNDLVIHEKTGILASSQEGALADSMLRLARNPADRLAFGSTAQRNSQRYHIKNTVEKTIKLYRMLLSGQSNRLDLSDQNPSEQPAYRNRIRISH